MTTTTETKTGDAGWLVPCLLSLALGLFIGWVDSRVEPVQLTVLLLLACGFGLGLWLAPARVLWLCALLLGAGVFLFHVGETWFSVEPRYPSEPNIFASLLALAPAFIGMFAGALARKFVAQVGHGGV